MALRALDAEGSNARAENYTQALQKAKEATVIDAENGSTLSNLIIVPSQFACHPGSVSPCLLPSISGPRGSISQGILGLSTTVRVFFAHINRVPEQPPHWTLLPDELIRIMVGVGNTATAGSRTLYRR